MPLIRKPADTAPVPAVKADPADVMAALSSVSTQERWSAARVVGELPQAIPAIVAALRAESEASIREALFSSLGRIDTPESIEALAGFLHSDDPTLRTGALDVLRSRPSAVRAMLPRLLADPDMDVRIVSCELARSLPGAEASPLLCAVLAALPPVNVCAAAIDVLAEVGEPEACAVLAACRDRFPDEAFIGFAVKVATDRITAQRS